MCNVDSRWILEEKIQVDDYMTAMEFYRDYREVRPGVLILDIRLPGMSGIELQEKLEFLIRLLLE